MAASAGTDEKLAAFDAMDALRADIMRADAGDPGETDGLLRRALVEGVRYARLPGWAAGEESEGAADDRRFVMSCKPDARSELESEGRMSSRRAAASLMAGAKRLGGGALGCACGCGADGGYSEWRKGAKRLIDKDGRHTPAGKSLALELARLANGGELFGALRLWVHSGGERPWLADAASYAAFAIGEMPEADKELAKGALAMLADVD